MKSISRVLCALTCALVSAEIAVAQNRIRPAPRPGGGDGSDLGTDYGWAFVAAALAVAYVAFSCIGTFLECKGRNGVGSTWLSLLGGIGAAVVLSPLLALLALGGVWTIVGSILV